jgi:antigen flippase
MLLRLVRTKVIAVLLGPGGVGLVSIFNAIAETIHSPASAGFGASGVQQLARHHAEGSELGRDLFVIRTILTGLACLGALALFLGREWISTLSFGDGSHAGQVGLLSIVVLLSAVAAGNTTILQGLRRIRTLARFTVASTLIGTTSTVVLVLAFGESAIVPSLIAVALAAAAVSCWYVRDLPARPPSGALRVLRDDSRGLLSLGGIFLFTHLMSVLTDYAVRLLVLQSLDVSGAGLYHAAWTLAGLYVGFVLNAMATDFYPRLAGAARDNQECNRLVNEQVEVGLLLAGPGILACLTLAPWLVRLCYSTEFSPAVDLLRLVLVGMLLRVITWPLGYILRAKRHGRAVLWTEFTRNALHLALSSVLIARFGLVGAGLAVVVAYLMSFGMVLLTGRSLTSFRFHQGTKRLFAAYAIVLLLATGVMLSLGSAAFLACGLAGTVAATAYSLRRLYTLGALRLLPERLQRALGFPLTSEGVQGGQADPAPTPAQK